MVSSEKKTAFASGSWKVTTGGSDSSDLHEENKVRNDSARKKPTEPTVSAYSCGSKKKVRTFFPF
jgi:hypothetical protein